ncbi:MAG: ribonuclease P protein component [Alcaligenaceae bacterium]|nr:ribonuclease P protein component [Alcaligenaceae bacterium]
MPSATYPKAARLHRPSEFTNALKGKRVSRGALFTLSKAHPAPPLAEPIARLGLVIAKRFAHKATTRNAIKRVARESFRHHRLNLPASDYVIRLHGKIAPCSLTELKTAVRQEVDRHFTKAQSA